jgi:putative peptidoglycan lipid II flippase
MSISTRPFTLEPAQREELERVLESTSTGNRLLQRAHLLLGLADGLTLQEVAELVGMSSHAASTWVANFEDLGVAGLYDVEDRPQEKVIAAAPQANATTQKAQSRTHSPQGGSGMLRKVVTGFMTVAAITLLAKAVSFFKDAAVAHRFGVSDPLDAFLLAFGVHTFASGLLIGGLPGAFLPVYAELGHRRGKSRAARLGMQAAGWHGLSLLAVATIIYAFAPTIVEITGAGFSPEKQALATTLLRGLIPFMLCYGMTGLLATWLRAEKTFVVASAAPILTPAVIFLSLLAIPHPTVEMLMQSTNWGCAMHLALLMYAVAKTLPFSRRWLVNCFRLHEPLNRAVIGNAVMFLISGSIHNSSPQIDQAMAAWLEQGSVSVLNCSDKICGIVLALTASAASETLFPYFADVVARQDWHGVRRQLTQSIGLVLAVAIPLAAFLIWQSEWVVQVLFERGHFTHEDTLRVAGVLRFAALQIPFYIAGTIMSKMVVSMQSTLFMVALSVGTVVLNVVFNVMLMKPLGVAGIALSTAFVHLCSTLALYWFLNRGLNQRIADAAHERSAAV